MWSKLILATNVFHNSENSARSTNGVEWYHNSASLFIQLDNRKEIKLGMDSEIYDVKVSSFSINNYANNCILQYENILAPSNGVWIFMKMLYSGPIDWAEGTSFDPYYSDRNNITFTLCIDFKNKQEDFKDLIQWMKGNVPTECAESTTEDADILWNNLSMYKSNSSYIYMFEKQGIQCNICK